MPEEAKRPVRKTPVDIYRKTEVVTANRETILLMMYAGAIRFLKGAIEAAEKGEIEEHCRLTTRTLDIVTELRATLNFEIGGDIAEQLDLLYAYVTQRLFKATAEKQVAPLKEALNILNTLNSAWEGAIASLKKEKEKEPTPAAP